MLNEGERPAYAEPVIHYVAPDGDCNGESPCYDSIQEAVDAASHADEIKIATGDYEGVSERGGMDQTVYLSKSLTLRGGYTTTNWSEPNPDAYPTELDALTRGRVLVITGTITPTIEGLILTRGDATELGGIGGGVYVNRATVTMSDCLVTVNYATTDGDGCGGGLYLYDASATLVNNRVVENVASEDGDGLGGGVCAISLTHSLLSQNVIQGNTGSKRTFGDDEKRSSHDDILGAISDLEVWNAIDIVDLGLKSGLLGRELGRSIPIDNPYSDYIPISYSMGIGGGFFGFSVMSSTLSGNEFLSNTGNMEGIGMGGGLFGYGLSNVNLDDNRIVDNTANYLGVGIGGGTSAVDMISSTMNGNEIINNIANWIGVGTGGGLSGVFLVSTTLESNLIVYNDSNLLGAGAGGGVSSIAFTSSPIIDNQIITNTANWYSTDLGGLISDWDLEDLISDWDLGSLTLPIRSSQMDSSAYTLSLGMGGGVFAALMIDAPIDQNVISSNTAVYEGIGTGGGILAVGLISTTMNGNELVNNVASVGGWGLGGGLSGILLIGTETNGNSFESNVASREDIGVGGGLMGIGLLISRLSQNDFVWNTASEQDVGVAGGVGGLGLLDVELSRNRIISNTATYSPTAFGAGGGAFVGIGYMTMTNNLLADNHANTLGSGLAAGIFSVTVDISFTLPELDRGTENASLELYDGLFSELFDTTSEAIELAGKPIESWERSNNRLGTGFGRRGEENGLLDELLYMLKAYLNFPTMGQLIHNTIADNHGCGQGVYAGANSSLWFTNTLIAGHTTVGITTTTAITIPDWITSANESMVFMHSTLWHENGAMSDGDGLMITDIDLGGDPAFVAPEAWDYHIETWSNATNQGVPAGVEIDLDGQRRMGNPDIGAYEVWWQINLPLVIRK